MLGGGSPLGRRVTESLVAHDDFELGGFALAGLEDRVDATLGVIVQAVDVLGSARVGAGETSDCVVHLAAREAPDKAQQKGTRITRRRRLAAIPKHIRGLPVR